MPAVGRRQARAEPALGACARHGPRGPGPGSVLRKDGRMSYPAPRPDTTAVSPSKGHHCGSGRSGQMLPWGWSPHPVSVIVTQSCPTLCNPTDCSPPGSSVHGILQARTLEWVARPFSRKSSQPGDRTRVPCIAGRFFTTSATWESLWHKDTPHTPNPSACRSVHPGL